MKTSKIAIGGSYEANECFIEPTILIDVNPNDVIMEEEIFGPVLPLVVVENVYEAINFINRREKPLALYIFSKKEEDISLILENTSSGNVTVNDTLMHTTVHSLPFGGVGNSGMGLYHGKYSFDTFVHKKGVLKRSFFGVAEKFQEARYPPYCDKKIKYINTMVAVRKVPFESLLEYFWHFLAFIFGVVITVIITYFCVKI